jgi:hypothetical protein
MARLTLSRESLWSERTKQGGDDLRAQETRGDEKSDNERVLIAVSSGHHPSRRLARRIPATPYTQSAGRWATLNRPASQHAPTYYPHPAR